MSTFLELKTQIADELDDPDLLTGGQIARAVKTAIRFYERKKLYFNSSVSLSFNTVAGQEYYGAADLAQIPYLISVDLMKATLNGVKYDVVKVDPSLIDSSQSGTVVGTPPTNYAYVAQQIRLFGIPDDVYAITLSGATYRLADLAADADTNAWTTDAEELIRQAAKRILMSDVTKELPPGSGATPAEMMALDALRKETRLRMGSPPLRADELSGMQGRGARYNIYTNAPA